MASHNAVIVFIGSFDPVHRGHIEAAEKALESCPTALCTVFLPNNPRKGKPERSALQLRCHWLSFHMKLYNNLDWIENCRDNGNEKMFVCDTRDCSLVVQQLKTLGHNIIGLIGSDIVKQPKLEADSWVVMQRVGYPFSPIVTQLERNSDQTKRILTTECVWQHLSSSVLRSTSNAVSSCGKELHKNLLPFAKKNFSGSTLSCATVSHRKCVTEGNRPAYAIEYIDVATAERVVNNRNLLASQTKSDIGIAKVLEWSREDHDKTVYFELLGDQTVFDVACEYLSGKIVRELFETIVINAFFHLQQLLRSVNLRFPHIAHGDPSSTNVMVSTEKSSSNKNSGYDGPMQFKLIDFEILRRIDTKAKAIENYTKFSRSFNYYSLLRGFKRNQDFLNIIEQCENIALCRNKGKVF